MLTLERVKSLVEAAVETKMEKTGLSRARAHAAVMSERPDLQQAWLEAHTEKHYDAACRGGHRSR
jgi:hypothetical protein